MSQQSPYSAQLSLLTTAGQLLLATREQFDDLLRLAARETRLASVSLAGMILAGIFAGGLVLAGWGLAMATLVLLAHGYGIAATHSLPALAIVHLLLAYAIWRRIMRLSADVSLPATRRAMGMGDD